MPLHFYGIEDGSSLELLKPYIGLTIENNFGNKIYWRLKRKDLIKDAKVKVALTEKYIKKDHGFSYDEINKDSIITAEGLRIYLVTDDLNFNELDDDETVDGCKIKDGDMLFMLSYRWLSVDGHVTVYKNGIKIQGVEAADTILGIKLRVQDQTGLQADTLNVLSSRNGLDDYFYEGEPRKEFDDWEKPFTKYSGYHLIVITDEELEAEAPRIAEEWKAEQERKQHEEE